MKVVLTKVMLALVLIGLGVGINVTYESYRGTGLSSVPELGPRRLEAAQPQASGSPVQSRSETPSKEAARPDAPAVRPDLAALRSAAVSELTLYPTLAKGMRTPSIYGGIMAAAYRRSPHPSFRCASSSGLSFTANRSHH
ncbi:MAG: hypothetical protein O2983_03640 [Planctomycetota bacterium]|nr:hypothetical protein [Planctomycetota bacterium]MDA1158680.1 hypothetical protein [Planctomycetota bacterium]